MLVTFLVFIFILGVMVFVHELGHFLIARRNGVRVDEFAFGFKPRLFSKKVGDTTYAINLIPLGGYVRMAGESDDQAGPDSYKSKTPLQKAYILVAGSTMNALLGILIFSILFIAGFEPFIAGVAQNPFVNEKPAVSVGLIQENSPAAVSGFKTDDKILAVNGETIVLDQDFINKVKDSAGQPVTIQVERNGSVLDLSVTPRVNPPAGQGAIGIGIATVGQVRSAWYLSPLAAVYETGRIIGLSAANFVSFVKDFVVTQKVSEDVTGIVGVGALTGVVRRLGIEYVVQLVAIISIGLGVVNLMPILPLDGGHLSVIIYEKISRRKLSEKTFGKIATVGLVFILIMFLAVTFKDVIRFDVIGRLF